VGVYRDGDSAAHVLRTTTSASDVSLNIATSRYFNDDYVAIAEGTKIDVLYGSYPSSATDTKSLAAYGSFSLPIDVQQLSFSPKGFYILAQHASVFAGYDIEHKTTASSSVTAASTQVRPLQWLDNANVWSDADGQLTMREFDGANTFSINTVDFGQDATLTKDGRYIYSIAKSATGYQLQRVRMILP
jgi:hypothetical protein